MSSELNFACFLANPNIRSEVEIQVKEITWNSPLAKKLVDFFTSDIISSNKIETAQIRALLSNTNVESKIDEIVDKCSEAIDLGTNVAPILEQYDEFYKTRKVTEILATSKADDSLGVEYIVKEISKIKSINNNGIPLDVLGELDAGKVIEEELGTGGALPTNFEFIKRATPFQGYLRGQVIQVVAPPGVGKSNFLANEAVKMLQDGYSGYFVALGDMMRIDFITRFTSIILNEPFNEVSIVPQKYYTDEVKSLLKNLRITVVPAGQLTSDGLCNFIETQVQPQSNIDFVMVDYDSNFQKETDSMYTEGDNVYNKLSEISRPSHSMYRTVFVASQPKIQYWGEEELPMECAAESSRKQAIIDLMITIGQSRKISRPAGIMKVTKARRGRVGEFSRYKVDECGHFIELGEEDYRTLKVYGSGQ